jgi:iron complex outermembrane receptor protein
MNVWRGAQLCIVAMITSATAGFGEMPLELPAVRVTAEKRPQALQDVPMSVSVFDADRLENPTILSLRDVSYHIPNLYMSGLSARRTSFPFIRGLGSGQGEPVVTTYIDGVPQLTPNTIDIELLDLQRVEVLRGPQGTLYGRNTQGGVIHLVTRQAEEAGRAGSITIGEFGLQRYDLSMTTLPSKHAALSLSGVYTRREGYTVNDFDGSDVDDRDTIFGRGQLRLTPTENLEIVISVHGQVDRDGDFVLADLDELRQDPHRINHDYVGYTERDLYAPSVTIKRRGDRVETTSITAFTHWDADEKTDLDFTDLDLLRREVEEEQDQFFQELRWNSADDAAYELGGLGLDWLFGLSYFHSDFEHDSVAITRPNLSFATFGDVDERRDTAQFELEDYGIGVFGHATLAVTDRLELAAGVRYAYERKEADVNLAAETLAPLPANVQSLSDSFDEVLPRVSASLRLSESVLTYVSAAKGFRSGGYNHNLSPAGALEFDEESSWTYEIGVKSTLFDNRVRLNAALFQIDWEDMQLDVPITGLPGRFFLDNAGEAESRGFECELTVQLTQYWDAIGGVGYTDATFDSFIEPLNSTDVAGHNLPNVPEFTWSAALRRQQTLDSGLQTWLGVNVAGVGEFQFDNLNTERQNDYTLINLRGGFGKDGWRVEGWVRNLFDEEFIIAALPPPAAFATASGFAGRSGEPRMAGVTLSLEF